MQARLASEYVDDGKSVVTAVAIETVSY